MKEGWRNAKLGEAFKTVTGSTPSKRKTDFYGDDVPLIKPPELEDSEIVNYSDHLSVLGAKEARLLPERSVLVSCIGNLGKIGITNCVCASNQQINAILPNYSVALPEFIFYQTLSPNFKEQLEDLATGTTLSIVNKTKFNRISIPVPPLPEQEAIVEILDQAFAAIDQAKANIEQNIANAKELFQSKLNQIFSQKGNGWVETTLGESCKMYQPKTIGKKDMVPDGKFVVFGANGPIGRYHSFNHEESQLLVTCRGATCGSVNISEPKSWITGNAMVIQPLSDELLRDYLEFALRGGIDLDQAVTGSAQPQITRTNLKPITFSYPDKATQKQIVSSLRSLTAKTAETGFTYQTKLTALEELKKSILQKAFAGELT